MIKFILVFFVFFTSIQSFAQPPYNPTMQSEYSGAHHYSPQNSARPSSMPRSGGAYFRGDTSGVQVALSRGSLDGDYTCPDASYVQASIVGGKQLSFTFDGATWQSIGDAPADWTTGTALFFGGVSLNRGVDNYLSVNDCTYENAEGSVTTDLLVKPISLSDLPYYGVVYEGSLSSSSWSNFGEGYACTSTNGVVADCEIPYKTIAAACPDQDTITIEQVGSDRLFSYAADQLGVTWRGECEGYFGRQCEGQGATFNFANLEYSPIGDAWTIGCYYDLDNDFSIILVRGQTDDQEGIYTPIPQDSISSKNIVIPPWEFMQSDVYKCNVDSASAVSQASQCAVYE